VFLDALRVSPNVTVAAKLSGHAKQKYYELRKADEGFAAAWEEALEEGISVLEQAAFRYATEGAVEEVRDGDGKLVSSRRRPDPASARYLLSAHKPEVYSERRRLELSGGVTVAPVFEPDWDQILDSLEQAGLISRGPAALGGFVAPLLELPPGEGLRSDVAEAED